MKRLVFFDFCGTITATNNTYDFIFYYLKSKKKYFKLLCFLFLDSLNIIKNFFFFIDRRKLELSLRKKIILLLKDEYKDDIYQKAREFSEKILKLGFYNKKLLDKIKKISKKTEVYIISASIDPVIKEFFKNIPIKKIYSSKMIFDKDKFNGEIKDYLYNKEKLLVKNFKKEYLKKSLFYTDNKEDFNLNNYFKKIIKVNSLNKSFNKIYSKTINKKNYILTYLPSFYYFISRPLSFIYFFVNEFLIFFSYLRNLYISLHYFLYLIFFIPVYEISSLFNDYYATKFEKNPTLRIEKNVNYNIFLFVLIRILYIFFLFFFIFKKVSHYFAFFLFSVILITFIGILHSLLDVKYRNYSMFLIRFTKLLPFYFLISEKINFFSFVSLVFIIQFLPIIFYFYDKKNLSLNFIKKSFFIYLFICIVLAFFDFRLIFPFLFSFILRYLSFLNYLRSI